MIWHHFGKPPAYAYLPFRLPKQKEPAIGGLISSGEINCEFLTTDGWQIEGEQSSFGHDGCGGREYAKHLVLTTDLLRESRGSCHSRHAFPHIRCIIQASHRRCHSCDRRRAGGGAPRAHRATHTLVDAAGAVPGGQRAASTRTEGQHRAALYSWCRRAGAR